MYDCFLTLYFHRIFQIVLTLYFHCIFQIVVMLGRRLGPHRILYEILQALHHASILRDSLENPSRTPFPKQLWTLDHWLCLACDPDPHNNPVHFEMHKLNQFYVGRTAELALKHYSHAIQSRIFELRSMKISPSDMNRALATATRWGNSNYRKRNSKLTKSPFHRSNLAELEQIALFNSWTGIGYKGSSQTDKQPPQLNRNPQAQPSNTAKTHSKKGSVGPTPPAKTPLNATTPPQTQPATKVSGSAARETVTATSGIPVPKVTVPPAPVPDTNGPPAGTSAEAGLLTASSTDAREQAGSAPCDTPRGNKRAWSRLSTSPTTSGSNAKRVVHEARPASGGKRGVASAKNSDSTPQHSKTKTFPPSKSFSVDLEGRRTKFNEPPPSTNKGSPLMAFWFIPKVTKKILMIGDEQLNVATELDSNDTQIATFPGLKLNNLCHLFENFRFGANSQDPGQIPTDIFISLGKHNRGASSSTNHNEISKVLRLAKRTFPGSKIHMCKTPISRKIPEGQERVLQSFNNSVENKCGNCEGAISVPLIASDQFEIDSRDTLALKWSQRCANAMIRHYLSTLN